MGEADTETPAAECVEKLDAIKKAGASIEWHVYPATTLLGLQAVRRQEAKSTSAATMSSIGFVGDGGFRTQAF